MHQSARQRQRRGNPQPEHDFYSSSTASDHHHGKKRKVKEIYFPFFLLFVQTALVLATLCLSVHFVFSYLYNETQDELAGEEDDGGLPVEIHENVRDKSSLEIDLGVVDLPVTTYPPLPVWVLSDKHDPFSLAKYQPRNSSSNKSFWLVARGLRREFLDLYGGENAARALLERGLSTFPKKEGVLHLPSDLIWTACRIKRARTDRRTFQFAFGGYSVTLGQGNWFKQSFPLVMEKLLATAFSTLSVPLVVRNAAIGGCSSFPYGFCMSNFWGEEVDVVSWDFSMNEAGGDARGLEAYIRHVAQLPRIPKLIVKDTEAAADRRDLLQIYADHDVLRDPVVLHTDPAARPFLDRREQNRPEGFKNWRVFGAPQGGPGQALHHPAVKEHELNAWLLAMHFLRALEVVAASDNDSSLLKCPPQTSGPLPPPKDRGNDVTVTPYQSLFVGTPAANDPNAWHLNQISCRTSYQPIHHGTLDSIHLSGAVAQDLDVMLPKSKMFYNQGWVKDLSNAEKLAKTKLDVMGGLGFHDLKEALYGIYTSNTLRFFLPLKGAKDPRQHPPRNASHGFIKSVVACQVTEKRPENSCQISRDMMFHVGGQLVQSVLIDAPGSTYLGQPLCVYLPVPNSTKLATRKDYTSPESNVDPDSDHLDQVGIVLAAKVNNSHIVHVGQACSISHVIWEEVEV